jgi:hypothetical protein
MCLIVVYNCCNGNLFDYCGWNHNELLPFFSVTTLKNHFFTRATFDLLKKQERITQPFFCTLIDLETENGQNSEQRTEQKHEFLFLTKS